VKQTEKPFPFEYWWREVKDEPKWLNRDVASSTTRAEGRNKMSASEAYTSSTTYGKDRLSDDNVG
jgi:hypothetical protein